MKFTLFFRFALKMTLGCISIAVGGSCIRDTDIPGIRMEELSMGMSGDYRIAARHGATMVRVGSAIFGPRG